MSPAQGSTSPPPTRCDPIPDAAMDASGRFARGSLRPVLLVALAGKLIAIGIWSLATAPKLGALFFFGPDIFVLHGLFAPSSQALCRVFTRFATDRQSVWLTIDDGPDETDTPQLLDLLDRHHARATFFVVGERAARHPRLLQEIVRRGHEIGHHTQTHPVGTFWCASPQRLASELDATLAVFQRRDIRPRLFRAPVGIKHLFLHPALGKRGLHYLGWSIRSGDCRATSPEKLVVRILRRLRPGVIILLHEGPGVPPSVRITGIAQLLEALAARGYTCVIPDTDQLR